jgi:hypothetical protein
MICLTSDNPRTAFLRIHADDDYEREACRALAALEVVWLSLAEADHARLVEYWLDAGLPTFAVTVCWPRRIGCMGSRGCLGAATVDARVMWLSPLGIATMRSCAILALAAHELSHWVIDTRSSHRAGTWLTLEEADEGSTARRESLDREHIEVNAIAASLGFPREPIDSYRSEQPYESALAQWDPVRRFRRGEPLVEI